MTLLEWLAHPLVAGLVVAIVTAGSSAAVGTFVLTLRNHRLLTGDPAVDGDDGLVGTVEENERRSRANARTLAARTDGGEER